MPNVFRLYPEGKAFNTGWAEVEPYTEQQINAIQDPQGLTYHRPITSLPTPFARMALVEAAFQYLANEKNQLVGKTIYHQLVSDCLDVVELLFNADQHQDKLKYTVWRKQEQLDGELLKSNNPSHVLLGKTLKLYMEQDNPGFHFDKMHDNSFTIISYRNEVLAATSPLSLFFTSPRREFFGSLNICFGNDRAFDNEFCQLHQRSEEFQTFFHRLLKQNSNTLSRSMKHLYKYYERCLNQTNWDLKERLLAEDQINLDEHYDRLQLNIDGTEMYLFNGVRMYKRKAADAKRQWRSCDFVIKPNDAKLEELLQQNQDLPLVLQNNYNNTSMKYGAGQWEASTVVPYIDNKSLGDRRLPVANAQYPYLTVSDFLLPYLVKVPYPVHKERFFNGNLGEISNAQLGYLLPINAEVFFKYFTVEDLMGYVPGKGVPMFEMRELVQNSIQVTLRIPVQKGEIITLSRTYLASPSAMTVSVPELTKNQGFIVENHFSLSFFPFISTRNHPEIPAQYRVQLTDVNQEETPFLRGVNYSTRFLKVKGCVVTEVSSQHRHRGKKDVTGIFDTQYYALEDHFDAVEVTGLRGIGADGLSIKALVVPKWEAYAQRAAANYSFAIDFGTTNTHVEYKSDGQPKPFDISKSDGQVVTLFDPDRTSTNFAGTDANDLRGMIEREFLPTETGKDLGFPKRTVLSEHQHIDYGNTTYALADAHFSFTYQRYREQGYNVLQTNLKWDDADGVKSAQRIRLFLDQLFLMMRSKVLTNGGALGTTRIYWFYPLSMPEYRRSQLKGIWRDLYRKYFSENAENNIKSCSESVAPYLYYHATEGGLGGAMGRPVLNVDIGGETSDVVFVSDGKPQLVTSFRFASGALFGDAFARAGAANHHGLIRRYLPKFEHAIESGNYPQDVKISLREVLNDVRDKGKSMEVNNFFFSIEKMLPQISYNRDLANDNEIKVVFLYYLGAIVYHLAETIKHYELRDEHGKLLLDEQGKPKKWQHPSAISFSGNGCRILRVISEGDDSIRQFINLIFEEVLGSAPETPIKYIVNLQRPKEITCSGVLHQGAHGGNIENLIQEEHAYVLSYRGDQQNTPLTMQYAKGDELARKVTERVTDYHRIFLKVDERMKFANKFGVSGSSMDKVKKEFNTNLRGSTLTNAHIEGVAFTHQHAGGENDEISEPTFFYPVVHNIFHLFQALGQN